jgi:DNA-binding transcriptional ArsR family regulator
MTDSAGALMHALSDPTRRAIFERIARGRELSVVALTQHAGVSQPAVSQHLRALQQARLVTGRRQGRNTYYRAEPHGLAPLATWLRQHEALWTQRLDRLEDYLQHLQRKEKNRGRKR